ncbi:OmpA family protein [Cytophagaceae bacterium ABcell3]|nr:OmpA family protein [Cytophagaceae bacterium ABcell3]
MVNYLLQKSYFFILLLLIITSTNVLGQKRNKYHSSSLSSKGTLNQISAEHQFTFHNINKTPYYHNQSKYKEIKKLEEKENLEKLLPALEEYVRNFGIQNFSRDISLLWKLGQLYEVTGDKEKAKFIYTIALKNTPNKGEDERVKQYFSNWDRNIEKNFYVPLEEYYELVDYRRNIDTLRPPKSVFLNMGELVNDIKYPDYGPTINVQSDMMIFTKRKKRLRQGKIELVESEDLWYSKNYDGFWDEAEPFDHPVNSACNEGSATISRDGKTLYFTRCKVAGFQYDCADVIGNCDIYVTHKKEDGTWGKPENLGENVNTIYWDSQPTLSHTEDTLYFASDRPGGFGLSDIWYTYKKSNGTWAKAKNMGPVINTRENEVSPFYHPKYHVLYFSSKGHLVNFGNFDIYKSTRINGQWQEPKNIGPLVNGEGSEYYFTIDSKSKDLFYAKSELKNPDNLDLHSFPLPMEAQPLATTKFSGSLKDSISGESFEGIVSIIDITNGVEVAPKFIKLDGSFEFDLIDQNEYLLVIQGDDFFRIEEKFFLDGDVNYDIKTPSIKYNKWKFASLEFEPGKSKILPKMEADLNKVVDFIVDHPTFKLKISGHTDSKGNADHNLQLSKQRAQSIKEYIVEKGKVDRDRIEALGFGSQKPLVEEKTEADRQINRRVEFEIIKPGDKNKAPEDPEAISDF